MNDKEKTVERIKELYNRLNRKGDFKYKLARKLGMSVKYLTNYWFPNCDGITEIYHQTVLQELQDTINNQEASYKSVSNN